MEAKHPPEPPPIDGAEMVRKNARLGLIILAVLFGMGAVSYAAVPFYNMFCRVTGFGGTTQVAESLPSQILDRRVLVKFSANTDSQLPWIFKPENREIEVQLGQKGLASFFAKNEKNVPVTGTALYNVTPLKAGKYFNKVQCFCFDEQTLAPGEEVSMPVMFFVDPAMDEDPNMEDVKTITLSYTFFKAESDELDQAMEGFYNR
ncbi:MAG: cytochrome c oxidase assembly protein [Alphaproteobacteria bacterium]|nr:cytochrome c oxidase assembly protein [Alphaproteobacteria bacterium]